MKTAEKVPLLDFQKALVKVLLEKYNTQKSRHTSNNRPHDAHNPTRLTGRHFPSVFGRNRRRIKLFNNGASYVQRKRLEKKQVTLVRNVKCLCASLAALNATIQ